MKHEWISDRLATWAHDIDDATIEQATKTAELPIVASHVALMADAHLGYGCAIGSVVPTEGAIIPSAVGVDIGCGMVAARTTLVASDLPDDLGALRDEIEKAVPAGVGQSHGDRTRRADAWLGANKPATELEGRLAKTAERQLGTLGSGNHFVEVSLDGADNVWAVLHSGSRGPGNQLAQGHIETAKMIERHVHGQLVDPDLRWLTEGTAEFDHYVADLRWAQAYAWENRQVMLDAVLASLFGEVGHGEAVDVVNCHHNYAEVETHTVNGVKRDLWITRKGAIRAGVGDRGVIPGSMGTDTFIVEGLGGADSFNSSSHGAGRKMSRNQARKTLSAESLAEAMGGRTWLGDRADKLVDEHPDAYRDIEDVMHAQSDLVQVTDRLISVLNYKGT